MLFGRCTSCKTDHVFLVQPMTCNDCVSDESTDGWTVEATNNAPESYAGSTVAEGVTETAAKRMENGQTWLVAIPPSDCD